MRTMHILLRAAVILGGIAISASAGAAVREQHHTDEPHAAEPPAARESDAAECERRARAADPVGKYAGYPCWARYGFGLH
jgi:hypothetical protein